MSTERESAIGTGTYVASYLALLVLTASTFGLSYVELGAWEVPIALGIATLKGLIVALYFMHLAEQGASHRIAAVAAVLLITVLVALAAADVRTRGYHPYQVEIRAADVTARGPGLDDARTLPALVPAPTTSDRARTRDELP